MNSSITLSSNFWITVLPSEWKLVSLTDVLSFVVDNRGKTIPTSDEGIPLIATNCVNNNDLFPTRERIRYVNSETYNTWFKSYPLPGDILFVNKGTPGRVCLVPEKIDFCFAQDMVGLRANEEKMYNKYLLAVLRSPQFQEQVSAYSVGTMIPHCKKTDFDKLVLPIPLMEEQKKIGDLYYALSEKIEVNNQINKKLEEMAQAIFKQWFVDFEFPNEEGMPYKSSGGAMVESELGMIPEGWKVGVVNDIGVVTGGGTPSKKREDYYTDKGIPWITPKDLSINKNRYINNGVTDITEEGLKNSSAKLMPKGTVLFSSRAPIGYMAIAGNPLSTNQGFKSVVPHPEYGTEFVYQLLSINKNIIENHASGSTFKEITGGVLKQIKILLPSKELIANYNSISESFGLTIKNHEEQISKLTMIRDTLLPKLMSGEIRVPIDKE